MSKFDKALYINGSIVKSVMAKDIKHDEYSKTYRGKLFCPNQDCGARLIHVEWEATKSVFFRTWNGDHHSEDCNYKVYYDEENPHKRSIGEIHFNISDDHILNRLETAYNKFIDNSPTTPRIPKEQSIKKIEGKSKKELHGKATLFGIGEENTNSRDPRIESRYSELLSELDNQEVRCVIGTLHSIHIQEDHAFINLSPLQYEAVSILLNPSFKSDYSSMFNGLKLLKSYHEACRRKGGNVVVCTVGLVELKYSEKVSWKYQISVDRDIAISFNGKTYYEISRESTDNRIYKRKSGEANNE